MNPVTTQETPQTDDSQPFVTSRDAFRAFLVAVALLAASSFGALLIIEGFTLLQTALGFGDSMALTFLVGGSLATFWLAVVGIVYIRVRPVAIHYDLRWPTLRDGAWVVGGLAAIVLTTLAIDVVVSLVGPGAATNISDAAAVENPVLIYSLFLVANLLFIAPVEEFLFRGVIQGRLRESFGAFTAISITSIGFAVTHLPSYWFGGSDVLSASVWGALLAIGATGFIFGYVYERTDSLLTVSIMHGLINAIGISLALIAAL